MTEYEKTHKQVQVYKEMKKPKKEIRRKIGLPVWEDEKLRAIADFEGTTVSQIILLCVQKELTRRGIRPENLYHL